MKNNKLYLQLFRSFVVATAVSLIFTNGGRYLGKTFYESQNYNNEAENLVYEFSQYVFNTPMEKDFEGALTVSGEEIEAYRTYYGSLAEQIQNIKEQYVDEINATQDKEVIEAIEQDRDAKIADIKKNFEDDEYVKEKILAIKKKAIQQKLKEIEREKKAVLSKYDHFAYEFKDKKTGEV